MFARRPILDRHPVQNTLMVLALGISVVMLTPQLSPVLGETETLPFFTGSRTAPTEIRFGTLPIEQTSAEEPQPTKAKGILMTGYTFGGTKFPALLAMVKRTEINAVVIDIKDERGEISWVPRSPMAAMARAGLPKIRDVDLRPRIRQLEKENVYIIGRIVTFQDPIMATARPDLALQDVDGGAWRNDRGLAWLDPYSIEAQDYNIALAVEAIELGFDEIQFDYVRFPSDGDLSRSWSRFKDDRPHHEVIPQFLSRAAKEIHDRGAFISADAFGLVALVSDDLGIGQKIELLAREVDYLSLMLYPSHYNKPEYGIFDPEKEPSRTVELSLKDAKRRIAGTRAKLRPWLQDFSLRVPYTPVEVREQIEAAQALGVDEWLLWNVRNRYSEDALRPAPGQTQPPPPPEESVVAR
jgi:hypothetical protein